MTDFGVSHPAEPSSMHPGANPRDEATLALFGHDLRAALSDVVGGLRLVDQGALDGLTRVQLNRVRVSAETLVRLLDQGLAVMLGEGPAVRPEPLNLHQFLTDLDLRWSGRAMEQAAGFTIERDPDLPVWLELDRVALDRVLSNLLGNAFKHAARGQVACAAGISPEGGLRIIVRDDGPGFPGDILDRSRRTPHPAEPGSERSSGMGLFIAADLAQRLGGGLTLRNLDPVGAQAQVDLPLTLSHRAEIGPMQAQRLLAGKRVLIADDNATSQTILARLVTDLGAEVEVVGDGVAAIDRLGQRVFDLLFVDMQMPRMSGIEVITRLRNLPGCVARMPVIAVTAHGLPVHRAAILAAGANDMLTKPLLCPSAFALVVRGVLTAAGSPLTAGPVVADPAMPAPAATALDQERLDRLLEMAGPETGRDLLDRLITDLSGVQRGLQHAARAPDWEAIRGHSHVLISLAGAVGGLQMQAEAEALNLIGHRMDRAALGGMMASALTHLEAMIGVVGQVRQAYLVRMG